MRSATADLANPAWAVQRLPDDHVERDYLRLEEIRSSSTAAATCIARWPSW
jgi:hypothetical protein